MDDTLNQRFLAGRARSYETAVPRSQLKRQTDVVFAAGRSDSEAIRCVTFGVPSVWNR